MVHHFQAMRTPVLVQVLLEVVHGQRFQQRVLAVMEFDFPGTIFFLVQPDDLAGVTGFLVHRVTLDHKMIAPVESLVAQVLVGVLLGFLR